MSSKIRITITLIYLCLFTSSVHASFTDLIMKILGKAPEHTSVKFGALVHHLASDRKEIFYPFADITFKNSLTFNAFQNTYHHFSASVAIKRNWFTYQFDNHFTWQAGYAVGFTYGYCRKHLSCEDHSFPALPSAFAFTQLYFSKHIGIYIILAGTVLSSGMTIRW